MADVNNKIKTTLELETAEAEARIKKLNQIAEDATRDSAERLEARNEAIRIQNKLSKDTVKNLGKESSAMKKLDAATDGVLTKMKAFITNPIGLAIAAIAGAHFELRFSSSKI